MLRFLLWRLLGLLALLVGFALVQWCLRGGPGRALRGSAPSGGLTSLLAALGSGAARLCHAVLASGTAVGWSPRMLLAWALLVASVIGIARWRARRRRTYVRLRIHPYRTDRATAEAVVTMFATVQFLDGPRGERDSADHEDAADEDGELAGVGAEEKDLGF